MIPEGFHPYLRRRGIDPLTVEHVFMASHDDGTATLSVVTYAGEETSLDVAPTDKVYTPRIYPPR